MRIEVVPNSIYHEVSCMLCTKTFTMSNLQAFILLDEDAPAPVCDQCAKSSLPDLLAGIRSRAAVLREYAEFLETIAANLSELPDPAAFNDVHD
jgi:hypothetical protein